MKPKLLILRPEPGDGATAARAAALGWETVRAPLFIVTPIAWSPPEAARFDAVMMTSANAARLGGVELARYAGLPVYAVGQATAEAARAAGFSELHAGKGDAEALTELAAAHEVRAILHLAGREHRAVSRAGMTVERRIVYGSDPVEHLPAAARAALGEGAIALLHSPRVARLLGRLVDDAGIARGTIRLAAISPAALAAAGAGWRATIAADAPNDTALLAAAARLCETTGSRDEDG